MIVVFTDECFSGMVNEVLSLIPSSRLTYTQPSSTCLFCSFPRRGLNVDFLEPQNPQINGLRRCVPISYVVGDTLWHNLNSLHTPVQNYSQMHI